MTLQLVCYSGTYWGYRELEMAFVVESFRIYTCMHAQAVYSGPGLSGGVAVRREGFHCIAPN